ncbi:hypothetical protein GCM10010174_61380 [Kutzneria viridogrisea]|uniref:Uncharacterized protein n=1 Tax=Kutzneria viridogrisea TaxID=47990 RepID=A0ABR6BGD1_9PSEU|nr:hypothetical protein [Kutzneria viridogrisea]
MAATLSDSADLAVNPTFTRKVRVALVTAALAVGQETSDITLDYYRLRRALATNVLANTEAWTTQFCWIVASVSTITNTSTDSDIQLYVNANWSSVAGAGPAPA